MTTVVKEGKEVITLPDFLSHDETEAFILYLKERSDRYGVKTLLYHSEMIQGHLERIDKHIACANSILIRVNGGITAVQKQFYTTRVARTTAYKFYSSMTDSELNNVLELHGYNDYCRVNRGYTRTDAINILVEERVKRRICEGSKENA